MTPIRFAGQNVTFAESQPQYEPLPALRINNESVTVVSC